MRNSSECFGNIASFAIRGFASTDTVRLLVGHEVKLLSFHYFRYMNRLNDFKIKAAFPDYKEIS